MPFFWSLSVFIYFILFLFFVVFFLSLHGTKHHQINIAHCARLVEIHTRCLNNNRKRLHAVRPDFGSTQQRGEAGNKAECTPHVLQGVVAFCGKALLGSFSSCGDEWLREREREWWRNCARHVHWVSEYTLQLIKTQTKHACFIYQQLRVVSLYERK